MDGNIISYIQRFSSDDICRSHLEQVIWKNGRYCPHCGSLSSGEVKGKTARPGLYQCKDCRKQFTVTVGTVFHSTKIPLKKWFAAMFIMSNSSKGFSTRKLSQWIELPYKTAWHMTHRIRLMMTENNFLLNGVVELDETYVGGKPRKGSGEKSKRGWGSSKQGVFVAVERGGKARAGLIAGHAIKDIEPHANEFVDKSAVVMTDDLTCYQSIGQKYAGHYIIQHGKGQYGFGHFHTNTAESFNAVIKRAVAGVFHYISKKHMLRYVNEIAFRWNHRVRDRVDLVISNSIGKKLRYSDLIK